MQCRQLELLPSWEALLVAFSSLQADSKVPIINQDFNKVFLSQPCKIVSTKMYTWHSMFYEESYFNSLRHFYGDTTLKEGQEVTNLLKAQSYRA